MKKITIQITVNVEYEQVHNDSDRVLKDLVRSLEDNIHQSVGLGMLGPSCINDELDVTRWEVNLKVVDPEKEKAQFQSDRQTNFAKISAFFSSDGPAVVANDLSPEDEPLSTFLVDVNGALREAFHKYRSNLREDK